MPTQDDLISALSLECDAAKHLFTKLPRKDWPATLAYRPTPDQRSTLELLRYLSFCGAGGCQAALDGTWDSYQKLAKRAESMAAEEFPAAMDRQKREIADLLKDLTDQDLLARKAKNPPGQEMTLGRALLDMPLRWLAGYRMQLFLYGRSLGSDAWTPDCWYGVHMDKPAKKA